MRVGARILIGVGTVLTIFAIMAVWIERQALDSNEWVDTSSKVLENDKVQTALSEYMADQLFAKVNLQADLEAKLPPDAKPLAVPISAAIEQAAPTAFKRAFDRPRIQEAWKNINRTAHQQLIAAIEDKGNPSVSTANGEVTLELEPLLTEVGGSLGAEAASKLPPDAGSLVILRSNEIETAQDIVKAMRGLAILFSILALACFALAIYVSRGTREAAVSAILWSGLGLILAGVAVLAIRHIAGGAVVDSLVVNDSAKPAGEATWSIGTSLLKGIATTVIVYGALFVAAAWLGSATKSARRVRQALAPTLRDHPGLVYGGLVVVALIYYGFAPTHGLRAILTLVFLAALAAFGLAALRRQAEAESQLGR
jgi:hypothetical protein